MEIKVQIVLNYYDGPTQFVGTVKTETMDYPEDAFGWLFAEAEGTRERSFVVYQATYNELDGKRTFTELGVFPEDALDWTEAKF